jgi:hypothetical protein
MHCPPTQRVPSAHGALVPHRQAPLLQRSVLLMSQPAQVPPFTDGAPHSLKLVVVVSHVDGELQQPVQPLVASQTQVRDENDRRQAHRPGPP